MPQAEDFLEQTVRDVTERVVQPAPQGGELVWLWRKADNPEAPSFMRYAAEALLPTFRDILAYVVRAVWYRAYRQGLEDARNSTVASTVAYSLLPAAVLNADSPNEETLRALLDAARQGSPNPRADESAARVLVLLERGASIAEIEGAVFETRDAARGDERWTLFCAEVLLHLTSRSVQDG